MVRLLAFVGLLGLGLLAVLAVPFSPAQRAGLRPDPAPGAKAAAPAPLPEAQRRLTESPADAVRRSLRPVVYGTALPVPPPPPAPADPPPAPPLETAEAPRGSDDPPEGWQDPGAGQWSDTLSAGWSERGAADGAGHNWFTNDGATETAAGGDWSASVSTPRKGDGNGGWIDARPVVVTLTASSSAQSAAAQSSSAASPAAGASASSANVVAREASRGRNLRVQARRANLRDGPATTGGVIEQLRGGEAVLLLEDPGTGWLLVRREIDGVEGWIAASLLGR